MFKCSKCEFFDTKDGIFGICVVDGLCKYPKFTGDDPPIDCPQIVFDDLL